MFSFQKSFKKWVFSCLLDICIHKTSKCRQTDHLSHKPCKPSCIISWVPSYLNNLNSSPSINFSYSNQTLCYAAWQPKYFWTLFIPFYADYYGLVQGFISSSSITPQLPKTSLLPSLACF
jgi:hypothetical protein